MPDTRHVVTFTAPRTVEVRTEPLRSPGRGDVLVQTTRSGISPGTERLVYRGDAPRSVAADASIDALDDGLDFPVAYGYSAVGRVTDVGDDVDTDWIGRRVFAFQPHASHFVCSVDAVLPLPDAVSDDAAVCLPSVETALTFALDGAPRFGERVVVFGQGVVGLLTTALLSHFPLDRLVTVDLSARRRKRSLLQGAHRSLHPDARDDLLDAVDVSNAGDAVPAGQASDGATYEGADLVFELTGRPRVLNDAIAVAGFDARIVVGSWYGQKTAPVGLGKRFHRGRMQIVSSQVSSIAPTLRGRWTKERRLETVLDWLPELAPESLITHRFSLDDAAQAYHRLDEAPHELLQPVFTYG